MLGLTGIVGASTIALIDVHAANERREVEERIQRDDMIYCIKRLSDYALTSPVSTVIDNEDFMRRTIAPNSQLTCYEVLSQNK
ncbi:hypothetical protein J4444_04380 [Candidatus Woesearchaeota archaeon]|nr:hypothetical protein [Candidatus Woesearchaeota archaeon]